MVVLFLTIPLMVLGLAVALGPLVFAIIREGRAVEAGASPAATTSGQTGPTVGARTDRRADETARDDQGVLVGV